MGKNKEVDEREKESNYKKIMKMREEEKEMKNGKKKG
jgi:glutaredoxin-related protein